MDVAIEVSTNLKGFTSRKVKTIGIRQSLDFYLFIKFF